MLLLVSVLFAIAALALRDLFYYSATTLEYTARLLLYSTLAVNSNRNETITRVND